MQEPVSRLDEGLHDRVVQLADERAAHEPIAVGLRGRAFDADEQLGNRLVGRAYRLQLQKRSGVEGKLAHESKALSRDILQLPGEPMMFVIAEKSAIDTPDRRGVANPVPAFGLGEALR